MTGLANLSKGVSQVFVLRLLFSLQYGCEVTKDFDNDLFPLRMWFFLYFLTQGRKKISKIYG